MRLVRAHGYNKVSIAVIAKEAGVARQTLYNRWDTKADLVLDALFEDAENHAAAPSLDDTRDIGVQLEEFLWNVFQYVTANEDMMRALIAAAQHDTAFHRSFYAKFVLPRDKIISDLLRLAQTRGEFSPDRDAELVSGLIHGAFWYRLLNRKPLDASFARAIVSDFFD